jgi:hypothetical protein
LPWLTPRFSDDAAGELRLLIESLARRDAACA